MKKISLIALFCAFVMPVMADDVVSDSDKSVVEQYEQQFQETQNYSNPEIKFPHGLQIGVGVSPSSGLNMFVGYNNKHFDSFWAKRFGIRFDFATYSPIKSTVNNRINDSVSSNGFEIDKKLKINNFDIDANHFGAMIDFYPFGDTWFLGGWRLSGGYFTGNLDLKADIHGMQKFDKIEFELGDRKYTYDGHEMHGNASVNWKYNGPYLGTGFDLGLFSGLKLYFDAGVVFADKSAKIGLDVPITDDLKDITSGAPESVAGEIQEKFYAEKAKVTSDIQKEFDKYPYYPLVKIGLMYRF